MKKDKRVTMPGMKIRRRSKRGWFLALGVFASAFLFAFLVTHYRTIEAEVDAASLANFDPGYIISDWQMSNYTSMSEAQIQAFLTSKNTCNETDYGYYQWLSNNSSYAWHWDNGHFVCLSEERFGDGEVIGSGETAAHIIWQAAQDYRINPQALIVLLQKETSLITDPIPNNGDYRKATGYGCPDSAPCSSQYYGFKNQVRKAAALFRTVLDGGWTNYPLGENYVQYNPDPDCGGTIVNIRSLATSALYRYTPYQPNDEALAAGYGAGSYCGAYGNRNFYLYFEDWFGGVTKSGEVMRKSSKIIEGEYIVLSNIDNGKAISIDREEIESLDTHSVRIEDNDYLNSQKWVIKGNGDETYTVINPTTGKALDVDGASVVQGANVQLYNSNGTCAQKWHIVENDDKTFSIYSSCSGLALDLSGGVANSGANINIWRVNGSDAQKWKFLPVKTIDDGDYAIVSKISQSIVIDIDGGVDNATDGTNIQVFNRNNTRAQEWAVKYDIEDGYYDIINPTTGKALDVQGGSTIGGVNIQLYKSNGTCAQKWQIVENDDKTFSIYSSCSGLVLDLSGGVANSGANINIWRVNGSDAQKWKFDLCNFEDYRLEEGVYSIASSIDDNKVVDITGGVSMATFGTNIQLWRDNKTAAQQWSFRLNNDGTYSIINNDTSKAIDVSGASLEIGANIQLWRDNSTCAQKWYVEKDDDNYYIFRSACSELVIDVSGGIANDGTNINLWRRNGTGAQKWILKRR